MVTRRVVLVVALVAVMLLAGCTPGMVVKSEYWNGAGPERGLWFVGTQFQGSDGARHFTTQVITNTGGPVWHDAYGEPGPLNAALNGAIAGAAMGAGVGSGLAAQGATKINNNVAGSAQNQGQNLANKNTLKQNQATFTDVDVKNVNVNKPVSVSGANAAAFSNAEAGAAAGITTGHLSPNIVTVAP